MLSFWSTRFCIVLTVRWTRFSIILSYHITGGHDDLFWKEDCCRRPGVQLWHKQGMKLMIMIVVIMILMIHDYDDNYMDMAQTVYAADDHDEIMIHDYGDNYMADY